jgi:general secretion pathway protein G
MRNRTRKAFTLVEILIVVVILGILAAIVVPQFTNATQDAQQGNLRAQIKEVQNQIELFKARTNAYPTMAEMTAAPTITGSLATDQFGALIDQGYIKKAPKNPAAPTADQGKVGTGGAGFGWEYDPATGTFGATYYLEASDTLDPGNP